MAVVALVISYLSGFISPDKWWWPSFFGLAYPVLLIINFIFVVVWLIVKPRYSLLSLAVIISGCGFMMRFIQVKGRLTEEKGIKVLSYNVKHFAGQGQEDDQGTAQIITQFFKDQEPDIICLQEVRLRKNTIFNLAQTVEDLKFIQHYQYARSGTTFGSVTMTRYPIVNMGEIRFKGSGNITIYTDVLIESDTVRIFNIHLQSYKMDPGSYSVIYSWPDEEGEYKKLREMGSRFKRAFDLRARQVQEIGKYIEECPYEIILCGDFNDTPVSYSYGQLSKHLKDAFVSSGKGIMPTYIGELPSLRIDYIFHSEGYNSYNFKTYDFRHSDHLPVSCKLLKK
ncbi:MAG: endonuclease/exonuclease/phosphatase family protein [Prolixibacteraceae bacterium]|nr:endonuclease/exonuclease/phosphatase family protein [Prolixibacteraceae bacterium]